MATETYLYKHSIHLLFECIQSWYLYAYPLGQWIHGSICSYWDLVTMKTEEYIFKFRFWSHISFIFCVSVPWKITINAVTCCYRNLVAIATEAYIYDFAVWSYTKFVFSTEVHRSNSNPWSKMLAWTPCHHGKRDIHMKLHCFIFGEKVPCCISKTWYYLLPWQQKQTFIILAF